tara:strand:- start:2669 stop:5389 length:2721 start_codon:yes stop_codon:yes gene_type:complete
MKMQKTSNNANIRRDKDLDLAAARSGAFSVPENLLSKGIDEFISLMRKNKNPEVAEQYMEGGSLKHLCDYSDRNTAVTGFLLHKVFTELKNGSTHHEFNEALGFPKDCTLFVSFKVDNIVSTKQKFQSSSRIYSHEEATGRTKRSGAEWEGFGVDFDAEIEFRFVPGRIDEVENHTVKLVYFQRVVVAPTSERRNAISVVAPPAQQFDVGAVVNILHNREYLDITELEELVEITKCRENFPRYNDSVQQIEHSLSELGNLVDTVVRFVAPFFGTGATTKSRLVMPWGPARRELYEDLEKKKKETEDVEHEEALDDAQTDVRSLVGTEVSFALTQFHTDQCAEAVRGLGPLGSLLQKLLLLKSYTTHFGMCYASIDNFMLRAFMKGIGDHNAQLFASREPIDPLFHKIGVFEADRAEIPIKNIGIKMSGCNAMLKMKFPGAQFFEEVKGIPAVDNNFKGTLCFGGVGGESIPVTGQYTRQVFVLPTESNGGKKPQMEMNMESPFAGEPVVAVFGTPDGNRTKVSTAFLLVDTWCAKLAIAVGAIPSNQTFNDAVSMLPPEMAQFAAAIRACDISEGGLDLHLIYLRPLLAASLGIADVQLKGDPKWMKQLVGLMRGGVSLGAIAQSETSEEWHDVSSQTSDLDRMKQVTAELEQSMLEQGNSDHYAPPVEGVEVDEYQQPGYSSLSADDSGPSMRSLGSDESEYRTRSLGSGVARSSMPTPQPQPQTQPQTQPAVNTFFGAPMSTNNPQDDGVDSEWDCMSKLTEKVNKLKTDDRDFMGTVMDYCEKTIENSEAVLGATLSFSTNDLLFAKGKVPDRKRSWDYQGPGTGAKWEPRASICIETSIIEEMLHSYCNSGRGSVPTKRLAVFGVLVEWETNLFKELMSGGGNPTMKVHLGYKAMYNLQKSD